MTPDFDVYVSEKHLPVNGLRGLKIVSNVSDILVPS